MRFDINLATHPYRDARAFYTRWAAALAVMLLLTLVLVGIALHEWMSTRDVARQIDQAKKGIAGLETERAQAQAILNRPENRGTRERSQFINSLIARKTFSWTQVFADLERIMPTRVHVVSIKPQVTSDNQLDMRIIVAGDSREKAVELVRNLEKSRHFLRPQMVSEVFRQGQTGGDTMSFEISALYVPEMAAAARPPAPPRATGGE